MENKQEIFLQAFEPVKKSLWKFCLSLAGRHEDAKDLLQDTIEIAYSSFSQLRDRDAFLSWVFSIASRRNIKLALARKKIIPTDPHDFSYLMANDTSPEKKFEIEELHRALNEISPDAKESIVLQEIFGFSQKEICEIQGISIQALKQRLHRAKNSLRQILEARSKTTNQSIEYKAV